MFMLMRGRTVMKITVIGTGYVGLVSGVCYAELGNEVVCMDKDAYKIKVLENGGLPIYEPGLQELVDRNVQEGRLYFTTDLKRGIKDSDIVFIAVGTPPLPNGEADLRYIEFAAREVADLIENYTVIAIKSTVPVGTNDRIKQVIKEITTVEFDIVSVPEFLREGSAVNDIFHPDRIIIGGESQKAIDKMVELHKPLNAPFVVTELRSAEMIKYASNAFLATKISFINEIANICERLGADIKEVSRGMGLDKRIGKDFLNAGIGYGGSCFPKDTKALIQIAGNADYDFKLLKSVVEVNQMQRMGVIRKLKSALGELKGKTIAIWGLAFKPGTDDVRESPALEITKYLLKSGCMLRLYDPIAMGNFRSYIDHTNIFWASNEWDAAAGADAVCLLTEWDVFKNIDLKMFAINMKQPILIDGRNVFDIQEIKHAGITYYPVGLSPINEMVFELEKRNVTS